MTLDDGDPPPFTHVAALRLVGAAPDELRARFCGHCGQPPLYDAAVARVCGRCGLGVMLECALEAAPVPGEAFLVLDKLLTVRAVSAAAERELVVSETQAVERPLGELLIAAGTEKGDGLALAIAVKRATHGIEGIVRIAVRPPHTFGVLFVARISACGPPAAALIVLE